MDAQQHEANALRMNASIYAGYKKRVAHALRVGVAYEQAQFVKAQSENRECTCRVCYWMKGQKP